MLLQPQALQQALAAARLWPCLALQHSLQLLAVQLPAARQLRVPLQEGLLLLHLRFVADGQCWAQE